MLEVETQTGTLPTWHRGWPEAPSLDVVRREIRRDAELARLGCRVGATRLYTAVEAATIRQAVAKFAKPERMK